MKTALTVIKMIAKLTAGELESWMEEERLLSRLLSDMFYVEIGTFYSSNNVQNRFQFRSELPTQESKYDYPNVET